jgi:hypothetical protein
MPYVSIYCVVPLISSAGHALAEDIDSPSDGGDAGTCPGLNAPQIRATERQHDTHARLR